jgi:hypothetical protein
MENNVLIDLDKFVTDAECREAVLFMLACTVAKTDDIAVANLIYMREDGVSATL